MAVPGRNFVINLIGNSTPAENAFKRVGQSAGRLTTPVGLATAAITASFAAVVTVVGKVGKELFDLGQEFDDVYDNIRIQTGMTGDALGALQDSFRDVARQVPNDFADIGVAIQDLNTRLGVSGDDLEDLAIQLLTVSRLMGGDVESNVRVATRLFGDFGVAAEDQADTLDMLFRASQASGQSFDTLADQTVNYGADLRALGFDLPRAVSALALFERTGVNTETVMSGLRQAVANLAGEGGNVAEGFDEAIRAIRDAEDASEALGIATDLVGRRYASNFLDTIRGGKFDLDEFIEQITTGSETITTAAEDTDGFRESWDNFKNYLKLTLEPVATEVFENMEGLVAELVPAVDRVKDAFDREGLQGALAQVAEEWDRIYENNIKPLWLGFLGFLNDTVKPIALELGKEVGGAILQGMKDAIGDWWDELFPGMEGRGGGTTVGTDIDLLVDLTGRSENEIRREFGLPPIEPGSAAPGGGRGTDDGFRPPSFTPPPLPPTIPGPTPIPLPQAGRPAGGLGGIRFFADGGIVTGPTLGILGEAGPEAIIPLDRGGIGTTVNITVTSADPQAVVEALRRYTRNNGPLGQVVAV